MKQKQRGFRVGQGIDIHPFTDERQDVILGGVKIEHPRGLKGHSDADVLIHAICDAMLGALALGDIGQHFSDTDPQHKNADSQVFLKHVNALIIGKGWCLGNLDATIITEYPKISPHVKAMQNNISSLLGVDQDQVSIKATRAEKLGSIGREEGLMVMANVLLQEV